MDDTTRDFPTTVSAAGEDIATVAGFLLGQWIGNQAFGSTLMVVADADTLRPDGALVTVEADLFSVGEEPHSLRILVTGVRDGEGMRIISADVHAPARLTAVQAVAHHDAAATTSG
jgi:hypothetical protein